MKKLERAITVVVVIPMTLTDAANVATIVTSIAAAVLGFLVYRLTRNTDRWNKFDRRLAIFQATRSYLANVVLQGTSPSDTATFEWWQQVAGYEFLFGVDVQKLIDEVWKDGTQLDRVARRIKDCPEGPERERLRDERDALAKQMEGRFSTVTLLFEKALDFQKN
jgi:hypothetical protein